MAGGYSRHFKTASFKVQAKKLYDGKGSYSHPVFSGKPYGKHMQLLIRNVGKRTQPQNGIYIKVVHYRSGQSSASKILMKNGKREVGWT